MHVFLHAVEYNTLDRRTLSHLKIPNKSNKWTQYSFIQNYLICRHLKHFEKQKIRHLDPIYTISEAHLCSNNKELQISFFIKLSQSMQLIFMHINNFSGRRGDPRNNRYGIIIGKNKTCVFSSCWLFFSFTPCHRQCNWLTPYAVTLRSTIHVFLCWLVTSTLRSWAVVDLVTCLSTCVRHSTQLPALHHDVGTPRLFSGCRR